MDMDMNFSFRNTTVDKMYKLPTISEYYTHLTPFIVTSLVLAALLFLLNLSIYCTTVCHIRKCVEASYQKLSIIICTLYPVISMAALFTIIMPKSWLVCNTIMHLSFTVGAAIFQRLCLRYVESEMSILKLNDGPSIVMNLPPCCCCCGCLPSLVPTEGKLNALRYLVWQMPIIQGAILISLTVLYFIKESAYHPLHLYTLPAIITSITFGIWSLHMTVRFVSTIKEELKLRKKMFCLQLILLLCKLQYLILDKQLNAIPMGERYPINHAIIKQTIINLLILIEMILVSLLVQNAYKTPIKVVEKL